MNGLQSLQINLVDLQILSQYKKSCLFEYGLARLSIEKNHLKTLVNANVIPLMCLCHYTTMRKISH